MVARVTRASVSSGAPETSVVFYSSGGHTHDGANSTLIDVSKYSIFDFNPSVGVGNGSARLNAQTVNFNSFKNFVLDTVNNAYISPQGIRLLANTITADSIVTNTITAEQLSAELILVNNLIRSNNYVTGSSGWQIASDGSAEFSNVTIRGRVESNTGNIGGWTITSNAITSGSGGTVLNSNGYILANSGKFSGQIESESGNIGGWSISSLALSSNSYNGANTAEVTLSGDGELYARTYSGSVWGSSIYTETYLNESSTGFGRFRVSGNASGDSRSTTITPTIINVGDNGGTVPVAIVGSNTSVASITIGGGTRINPSNIQVQSTLIGNFVTFVDTYTVRNSGSFPTTSNTATSSVARIVVSGANEVLARSSSLRKFKENIEDIPDAISILNALRPRVFNWKIDADSPVDPFTGEPWTEEAKQLKKLDKTYGFVVEEIHEARPDLIVYNHKDRTPPFDRPGGMLDINSWEPSMWRDLDMIALSVKAIQELNNKIEQLESRIQELEGL